MRALLIISASTLLINSAALSQLDPLAKARGATVHIRVQDLAGGKTGSGVLLTEAGVVATNAHVVRDAQRVTVKLPSGEAFEAAGAIDYDPRLDLALLVIPGFGLPVTQVGNSDSLSVGQHLYAIGSPLGLEQSVSDGVLSAVRIHEGVKRLQISVPVSPGSSGGPLVDDKGNLIGIVVSGIRGEGAENLNFAIPVNAIRGKLALLTGKPPVPFSQLAYESGAASSSGTSVGAAPVGMLNGDLDLDFAVLNGATLYSEDAGANGWSFRAQTRYATSRSPSGALVVERTVANLGRVKVNAFASQDAQMETVRTLFDVGPTNRASTTYSLHHYYNPAHNRTSSFQMEGTRYRYTGTDGAVREGQAPQGILPMELASAAVAALPDSIPDEVQIWVLDLATGTPITATYKVLARSVGDVPVATGGKACEKGTAVRKESLPVVHLQARISTSVDDVVVLARRPHLRVDTVKCVGIPETAVASE